MKTCSVCKVQKEESGFYKDPTRSGGLSSRCKACVKTDNSKIGPDGLSKGQRNSRKVGPDGLTKSQRHGRKVGPDGLTNQQRRDKEVGPDGLTHMQRRKKEGPERAENIRLLYYYGITLEHREVLYKAQNGVCAGCHELKKLCVDHDHLTGRVRGLLCKNCNAAIGLLKESPTVLKNLIEYLLKKHS